MLNRMFLLIVLISTIFVSYEAAAIKLFLSNSTTSTVTITVTSSDGTSITKTISANTALKTGEMLNGAVTSISATANGLSPVTVTPPEGFDASRTALGIDVKMKQDNTGLMLNVGW